MTSADCLVLTYCHGVLGGVFCVAVTNLLQTVDSLLLLLAFLLAVTKQCRNSHNLSGHHFFLFLKRAALRFGRFVFLYGAAYNTAPRTDT